jgi:hypothetical protein
MEVEVLKMALQKNLGSITFYEVPHANTPIYASCRHGRALQGNLAHTKPPPRRTLQ